MNLRKRSSAPLLIAPACLVVVLGLTGMSSAKDTLSGKKLYSQKNEELIIRDFFQDRRDGIYLDVGCAWPIHNSTTYYLEKHLGWSGIGVDANPVYGPMWKEKRTRGKYFQYLVSDHSDDVASFYAAGGVGSTRRERTIRGGPIKGKEIKVPTITLTRLLDDNGIKKIDFLSMDIELSEPLALAGFDIERFKPELVCIEVATPIRTQLLEYFTRHGYERIDKYKKYDRVNWYFRPKKDE